VKVLVAHNRYQSTLPSGENEVVDLEIAALREAGVQVVPYIRSSDEIAQMGTKDRFLLPFMPLHSRRAMTEIVALLEEHRPDLVHLHNPYPLISLSLVRAAHEFGVPVVQTVHNHRHSCARGSYFRDGHPCFECRGKSLPWPSVQHGCYRDSRLQSVALASALASHRKDQRAMDKYIALSPSIAESLGESGLIRPEQVVIRPNSVPDPGPPTPPGDGLLFVGRLTREKGLPMLLQAWERADRPFGTLTVIGEGPERPRVEAAAGVVYLGSLQRAEVGQAMAGCAAVVVPSVASEALPLVVLEAFSYGRPVVATRTGGLPSIVDASCGWLSEPDSESLARTLRVAAGADRATLGSAARRKFESTFSPGVVVAQQIGIYEAVISHHRRASAGDLTPGSPDA
jgi:glycosyltransferase involved in cell wall biosynthesis